MCVCVVNYPLQDFFAYRLTSLVPAGRQWGMIPNQSWHLDGHLSRGCADCPLRFGVDRVGGVAGDGRTTVAQMLRPTRAERLGNPASGRLEGCTYDAVAWGGVALSASPSQQADHRGVTQEMGAMVSSPRRS